MNLRDHSKKLTNVTLVGFAWGDEKYLAKLMKAYSLFAKHFEFGCVRILVSANLMGAQVPREVQLVLALDEFDMFKYNSFCIKSLDLYFDTEFVMIFQTDGFIVNPSLWRDEFLSYDYIGAPWWYSDGFNVGNGGFSIRSKKLQRILREDDSIQLNTLTEDHFICRVIAPYLIERYSITFASEEIAKSFSIETGNYDGTSLGIHGRDAVLQYVLFEHNKLTIPDNH